MGELEDGHWDIDECYGVIVDNMGDPVLERVTQVPPAQSICRGQEGLPRHMTHPKGDVILGTYNQSCPAQDWGRHLCPCQPGTP